MAEDQAKFEGYAIVEIMGHQTMAGYVTTHAFGNVVMFKVTQEAVEPEEQTLSENRYMGGRTYLAGTKLRARRDEASSYIGAASVYRMTPCSREDAFKRQPVIFEVLEEPPMPAIPAVEDGEYQSDGVDADSPF